jgi:hypothetical protein
MNYDNLKKIGYFNVANDIMMKRMALELDTDKIDDNKFSDILATLEKLKTQVDQIPEYEFKKMAIEDLILEIKQTIEEMI